MQIERLSERELAEQLRLAGIPVQATSEADDQVDAAVEITSLVHVSIPTFGGSPCVVREVPDGLNTEFVFGPEQSTLEGLVEQIRFHLEQAGQEVIQAVASAEDDYILDNGPSPC